MEKVSGENVIIAQNTLVQRYYCASTCANQKKKAFLFTFLKIWPTYYTVQTPTIICFTRKYPELQEICSNVLEAEFKGKNL